MTEPAASDPGVRAARTTLQERVAAAVLDAAARVLAERPDASMAAVAAAAGVARATVYRYFPTRAALLTELADAAIGDAGARLVAARLEALDARSALERAVRALVEGGDAFVVVAREGVELRSDAFDQQLVEPLRRVLERGQKSGELRTDVSARFLTHALLGLVVGVLRSSVPLGPDDLVSATTSLFADGAGGRLRAASGNP